MNAEKEIVLTLLGHVTRPFGRAFAAGIVTIGIATVGIGAARAQTAAQTPAPWAFGGADAYNSHAMLSPSSGVTSATQINPRTAPTLALKWSVITHGPISTTPTVEQGGLYVPDWAGYLYKLDPATGNTLWSHKLSDYTGVSSSFSRSSPAIGASVIVLGDDWAHDSGKTATPGARVIAVNKTTGALVWQQRIDTTSQWSTVLGGPVIDGNTVYVGTVSWEEALAENAAFTPTFRGGMTALNLATGAILWQFHTVPPGYTGGGVLGTSPVIWWPPNATQPLLIFGTGNNYSIPGSVGTCIEGAYPAVAAMSACLDPTDYVDAIVALNAGTGALVWARRMSGPDTYTGACGSTDPAVVAANCPFSPSPDYDFASQPNLATVPGFTGVRDDLGGLSQGVILGAGQKSGVYWGMNPADGGVFWSALIGHGGIQWGAALDRDTHETAYVPLNNNLHDTNRLVAQNGVAVRWNAGAWAAVDLKTGTIDWATPAYGQDLKTPAFGATSQGAAAFTNNVMFAGDSSGYFAAINPASGKLLWTYNSGAQVAGGPAIFNETVYWGTGTQTIPAGQPTLFAFAVP
jgi:polyvinyl alcohol dehydrogenase (cytochrome)